MSNLGLNSKVKEKFEGTDSIDNIDSVYKRLKEYNYDGKLLSCSDDFFNYFFRNCITRKTISDVHLINRRNNIIMILDGNTVLNEVSYSKSTMFFNYELSCNDEFDLTPDENMLLWRINDFCINSFPKQIGELYKTTKVFLTVSDNKKLEEVGWNNDEDDLLGYYTKVVVNNKIEPQVWLFMDKIDNVAKKSLCCDRKYVIASVYIHEMMHRLFDIRPDLDMKQSVMEIEEPMAEFAKLRFIEEFCKENRSYARLLPVAQILTDSLYQSNKWFIYSLGGEMYYNNIESNLIDKYRKVSMLLHKTEWDEKQQIELGYYKFSPMADIDTYVEKVADCKKNGKNLKDLMILIKDTIERYSNFFL